MKTNDREGGILQMSTEVDKFQQINCLQVRSEESKNPDFCCC